MGVSASQFDFSIPFLRRTGTGRHCLDFARLLVSDGARLTYAAFAWMYRVPPKVRHAAVVEFARNWIAYAYVWSFPNDVEYLDGWFVFV